MRAAIIPTNHDLRPAAEQLIAEVYALHYAACITTFPATLIGMTSDRDTLLCAAGLRFAADGFFSECYLDAPVDACLALVAFSGAPRVGVRGNVPREPRAAYCGVIPAQDHRLRRSGGFRMGVLHRHRAA